MCVAYVALRVWGLTDSCLWFDEIFGVHAAEHIWGDIFWFLAEDLIHPPFFYILLKIWMSIGGDGLLWLRLFPVLFSILSIIPFLYLCRELKLTRLTTIVAFALFAVNGSLIKYAQEVRMYSPLLFVSLMSIWLFTRFFVKGKSFAALILVNILLVHTHYFGWLVVGSEVVAIVAFQRIKIRQTLLMFGLTLLSFVPWMIAVYRVASGGSSVGQNIGWIERPGISAIFTLLFDLIEPFYFQMNNAEPGSLYYISVPLLLLIGVAKIAYLFRWLSFEEKKNTYLLEMMIGVPIATALILSWLLPYSIWGSRHLIIVYAPLLILTAVFLTEQKNAIVRNVFMITSAALIGISFVLYSANPIQDQPWCAWEKAAETLGVTQSVEPNTITPVYAFEDLSAYHLWFALRRDQRFRVFKVEGIKGIAEDKAYFLPRGFNGVEKIEMENVPIQSSYLVFRDSDVDMKRRPLKAFSDRQFEWRPVESYQIGKAKTLLIRVN